MVHYAVSPRKHVRVNGKKRAFVKFKSKTAAVGFIKRRKLKGAILYKSKR